MSHHQGTGRFVNLQSSSLQDDNLALFAQYSERSTRYSLQKNDSFFQSYAETDRLGALTGQGLDDNGDMEIEEELGGSFAGLGLSGNGRYHNSGIFNNPWGRTNNIGVVANQAQHGFTLFDPRLTPEFAVSSSSGSQIILTPSPLSNTTRSPSAGHNPEHRSERSYLNLDPPSYTPPRSSAAIPSQCSDSAWETDPTLSADEDDPLSMPEENSAAVQSYNDPQKGIWAQENTFAQDTMRTPDYEYAINPATANSIPFRLQQIMADADAATPFGAQEGTLLAPADFGAGGTLQPAASQITIPSTSQYTDSQFFQPLMNRGSGVSLVIDSNADLGDPTSKQLLEVEQSCYSRGSNHSPSSNTASRISLDDTHFAASNLPSSGFMSPPALATALPPSTDTSTSVVRRCTHEGCRAKFTGGTYQDSLRRHMKYQHGDKKKPACPVCHAVFGRPDNLKRHIIAQHPGCPLPPSRSVRRRGLAPRRRRS